MFKEILLPLDLQETELSTRAIEIAQDYSDLHQSTITVLTVIPDFGMPLVASYFPAGAMKNAIKEVCADLKRFIDARFRNPDTIKSDVIQGNPHSRIVDYAREHKTDLIILPATAMDISKVFLGSSSKNVVEHAPCSVFVVRP